MRPDEAGVQNQTQRERNTRSPTVTWLDPPVRPVKGWRVAIVGVCSDCPPDVAAAYGVRV
jgi:hypothetical protein